MGGSEDPQLAEPGRRRHERRLIHGPGIGYRLAENRRHQFLHAEAVAQGGEDLRMFREDALPGLHGNLWNFESFRRRRLPHRRSGAAEHGRHAVPRPACRGTGRT